LRLVDELHVRNRSPTPASDRNVSGLAPYATPIRVISDNPRVIKPWIIDAP